MALFNLQKDSEEGSWAQVKPFSLFFFNMANNSSFSGSRSDQPLYR